MDRCSVGALATFRPMVAQFSIDTKTSRVRIAMAMCGRGSYGSRTNARGALLKRTGRALRTLQVVHKRGRFGVGR